MSSSPPLGSPRSTSSLGIINAAKREVAEGIYKPVNPALPTARRDRGLPPLSKEGGATLDRIQEELAHTAAKRDAMVLRLLQSQIPPKK